MQEHSGSLKIGIHLRHLYINELLWVSTLEYADFIVLVNEEKKDESEIPWPTMILPRPDC